MRTPETSLARAREAVARGLRDAAETLSSDGLPTPALDGKALRPLAAYVLVPFDLRDTLDERFWLGALAIEMVHEASLLHDDILDDAPRRRGKPTMAVTAGVGPTLVLGDHLLTAAYRAASATESPDFLSVFIRSVERTVAGEIAQEKNQGRILSQEEYRQTITGKSGELFRSAFSLSQAFVGTSSSHQMGALGARFGALYQMVDDFLDYCTEADRGKVPLQDYRQKKWTWPLGLVGAEGFGIPSQEIRSRLFSKEMDGGSSPMQQAAKQMESDFQQLMGELAAEGLETLELGELLRNWSEVLVEAARAETVSQQPATVPETAVLRRQLRESAEDLHSGEDRLRYFGGHAKSFRFAARLFPKEPLQTVADVYAFCRFTDDLVDEAGPEDPKVTEARLDLWSALASAAYHGKPSGIAFLDEVMADMSDSGVPFSYAAELMEGVRMDLTSVHYQTLEDLRIYSYRVASVVGGWLTERFGVRDPDVLDRAFSLGHAMQLTNILRDVGEDLASGRLYLPEELMTQGGIDVNTFMGGARADTIPPGYNQVVEDLMVAAEEEYKRAFEAIPALPWFFQGPVAVAASVYRGIHDEIRRNGYDNLSRRAATSLPRKMVLATRGLFTLLRITGRRQREGGGPGFPLPGLGDEERQGVT